MSTNVSIERRYGVVSADERRDLGGLEFVQRLVTGALPLNTMARTLGYIIARPYPRVESPHSNPSSIIACAPSAVPSPG